MEIIEKIKTVLQVVVRDDNNRLVIPDGYVRWFFESDPDVLVIEKHAEKIVRLMNEAEDKNDIDFLNRDIDEYIRTQLD